MKKIIGILVLLLAALSAAGQDRSSASFGLDPSDREAVLKMRARSDSIRKHRPVVALVLSGGGAKGAAQIGALEYMEKYDIPVDMILGTSVGGLLAGFYCLGYTSEQLENLIRDLDWNMVLSDNVAPEVVPYSRRAYNEKYALSFPFYYRYDDRILPEFARLTEGGLDLSSTAVEGATSTVIQNLLKSLPSGVAYGENVNHVIASRTVGYSDSTDFFDFPIPFACVSTDLVSGKAKVWHNGNINMALRSTMSIPGLFAPARSGDMVMVDGGMRNNFPADIAKELGADIVIGIELSDVDPEGPDTVHNIVDIVTSAISMFSADSFERSMASADLIIKPDLRGFNMMSFDDASIEFMLLRGRRAAEEASPKLDSLKAVIGPESFSMTGRKAVDLTSRTVLIGKVDITGLSDKDARYVRSRIAIRDSSFVNSRIIEDNIARIFGGGSFDFITYELHGEEEPYSLEIHCQKGPVHKFGLGLRIDTEELVAALLNFGLNTNALSGPSLDFTAKIGTNPSVDVHGAMVTPSWPSLHLRANARWVDRTSVLSGENFFNISFLESVQEFYLSNTYGRDFNVALGIRNKYQNVRKVLSTSMVGGYDPTAMNNAYQSIYTSMRKETLDNSYFPWSGVSAGFRAEAVTDLLGGGNPFFGVVSLDARKPLAAGDLALIPFGSARFLIGDDIPIGYANLIGGTIRGRYQEQQIPFVGINYAASRRNYLAVGGADLRLRLGSNHYITATGNVSYDFDSISTAAAGELVWGAGLSYAYNTIVGPIKLLLHYSSLTAQPGAYISLGFDF